MPNTFGYNAAIGWGDESVWGTAVAVTKFSEVISMDIKNSVERQESPSTRGLSERRRQDYLKSWSGSFEVEYVYAGLEKLFDHLMGSNGTVVLGGSATGKTHTFTLADALPTGLTFEAFRGDSVAAMTNKYAGGKITSATFTFSPNDPVKITWNIAGKGETFVNGTAITYPDYSGILLAKGHQVTCEFGDSTEVIDSIELTVENGLDVGKRVLGSQNLDEPKRSERRKITGTLTSDWADKVNYLKFLNGTSTKLEIICTGPSMGNDNADPLRLHFTMPAVIFDGETPAISGPGIVKQTMPFFALSSGTGANDSLSIEMDNVTASV